MDRRQILREAQRKRRVTLKISHFQKNDCFKINNNYSNKWLKKEIENLNSFKNLTVKTRFHFEDVRKKPNKIECYINFNTTTLADLEMGTEKANFNEKED